MTDVKINPTTRSAGQDRTGVLQKMLMEITCVPCFMRKDLQLMESANLASCWGL